MKRYSKAAALAILLQMAHINSWANPSPSEQLFNTLNVQVESVSSSYGVTQSKFVGGLACLKMRHQNSDVYNCSQLSAYEDQLIYESLSVPESPVVSDEADNKTKTFEKKAGPLTCTKTTRGNSSEFSCTPLT